MQAGENAGENDGILNMHVGMRYDCNIHYHKVGVGMLDDCNIYSHKVGVALKCQVLALVSKDQVDDRFN